LSYKYEIGLNGASKSFTGRNVLITGTSRGIGRALATQFAAEGAQVLCHARDGASARALAAELGGLPLWGDLSSGPGVAAVAGQAAAAAPALHLLVHNAAINPRPDERLDEVELASFRAVHAVNVEAPLLLTQALLGLLRAGAPSQVIVVSSEAGQFSTGLGATGLSYRTSKAAANAFALVAAHALRADGIRVNAVHPGWVRTDMGGPAAPLSPEQGARAVVELARRDDEPTGLMFDASGPVDW
jgi:NAD(P)-dependent dehydrogenase (short-subunit alcohol dehydrogenase family)